MAPGSSTTAYIGVRAPIVPATNRTHALLVPVVNFTTLAVGNGPPGSARFGTPIELDMFERGFRSIEWNGFAYLIVAGTRMTIQAHTRATSVFSPGAATRRTNLRTRC
jgi:hypothetical protein